MTHENAPLLNRPTEILTAEKAASPDGLPIMQDDQIYWNGQPVAVVLADTTLSAHRLIDRALAIEDAFDRLRSETKNAPRTLDVDLIVVGDRRSDSEELRLPHPRAHERAFVLQPWLDLEPDAEFLDRGPVAELLAKAGTEGLAPRPDLVLEIE